MREKKRPPSLEALYSGALGEIRTPYPLVRSQDRRTTILHYLSIGYSTWNLSQNAALTLCNSLFCLDSLRINEMNYLVKFAKKLLDNLTVTREFSACFSKRNCS